MDIIKYKAYAKINLGLDVINKREDGYHNVNMIMQNIDVYDVVIVKKMDKSEQSEKIILKTDNPNLPIDNNNIAYRAALLMLDEYNIDIPIKIKIEKNIPISAGLAGGSTDAAAVLSCLNILFDLGIDKLNLMKLGLRLGADVPFCILGNTALAKGIGEILTPLSNKLETILILAKPSTGVSTESVYKNLVLSGQSNSEKIENIIDALSSNNLFLLSDNLFNLLETVTIPNNPIVQTLKDDLKNYGALNSLMSGSGPSVFGLFDDINKAEKAYKKMKADARADYLTITKFINTI